MKNRILKLSWILLFLFAVNPMNAQQIKVAEVEQVMLQKDGKYAILLQNSQHFMAAVISAEEYKKQFPNIEYHIVMIGPIVKELAENPDLLPFIQKAEEHQVSLVSCEFAMSKLGVKKSDYHPWVQTTPNAFSYVFGLKNLGFLTLEL